MTVLSDRTIKDLCTPPCYHERQQTLHTHDHNTIISMPIEGTRIDNHDRPMIDPFVGHLVRVNTQGKRIISYGLSSYGYDVRLADDEIKVFTNANGTIVDPMNMDDATCLVDAAVLDKDTHPYFVLPPNSYALGYTIETFVIPRNVSVICLGKSTLARAGAIVNVTPIEAGFEGNVVIEISNASPLPIKVYVGVGIAQFQFLRGDQACEVSYADGDRKYQGQRGVTLPKV